MTSTKIQVCNTTTDTNVLRNTLEHLIKNSNALTFNALENGITEVAKVNSKLTGILFEAIREEITPETVKSCQNLLIEIVNIILLHYIPNEWNVELIPAEEEKNVLIQICSHNALAFDLPKDKCGGYKKLVVNFQDWTFTAIKDEYVDLTSLETPLSKEVLK